MSSSRSRSHSNNTGTTNSRKTTDDVVWREYDIHQSDSTALSSQQDVDDEEEMVAQQHLFQTDGEELEELEISVRGTSIILRLTCQEDYTNSTGMAVWLGSDILAEYLGSHSDLVRQCSVLELGAGVGLCGLVAHHLGASRVLWTDGDQKVLDNLRANVARNRQRGTTKNDDATGVANNEEDAASSNSVSSFESCPQLIWGKHLHQFRQAHGTSQVILGTDLFYMTKSLDPLWETVDCLLETDGVFVAVNSCASQSPLTTVLEIASRHGFVWTTVAHSSGDGGAANNDEQIYLFRRDSAI